MRLGWARAVRAGALGGWGQIGGAGQAAHRAAGEQGGVAAAGRDDLGRVGHLAVGRIGVGGGAAHSSLHRRQVSALVRLMAQVFVSPVFLLRFRIR
jgi:hypothetical protein